MSSSTASTPSQALKLGRLVHMEWKVGVTVANSHCKRINSPFVRLCFHISDENDNLTSHAFQLSISEFEVRCTNFKVFCSFFFCQMFISLYFPQEFSRNFENIAAAI